MIHSLFNIFRFLGNLLVLDFGVTMPPELPISSMLAKSFPITLQLTLIGVWCLRQ